MTLDSWEVPGHLYLARADEVPHSRPLFTGDVFEDVPIPGVQESGGAIVLAHPCSIRGKNAKLLESILVGAVGAPDEVPPQKWESGYLDRMPLPELGGPDTSFAVAWLGRIGLASKTDI